MRPITLAACFLLVVGTLLSAGCQSLAGLGVQSPTAAVHAMDVSEIGGDGFTMDFDVEVSNPNAFALPLTRTPWTLSLGGTEAFRGDAMPDGSIPSSGTGRVTVPVSVTYAQLLDLGKALATSGGRVPYRFEAKLGTRSDSFGGLLNTVKVPLNYEGTLDLAALLKDPQTLNSPAARRLATQMLTRWLGS